MRKLAEMQKLIGYTARKIAKRYKFTITQLEYALIIPINNYKDGWSRNVKKYDEKTIHNYLFRSWPQMPEETAIAIISEAFETLLNEGQRSNEAERVKNAVRREIKNIYSTHKTNVTRTWIEQSSTEFLFTSLYSDSVLFVSKHFEACSSFTRQLELMFPQRAAS